MSRGPTKISKIMGQALEGLNLNQLLEENKIKEAWPDIVGKRISEMAPIEKLMDKKLYLKVQDSHWKMDLRFQSGNMVKKINSWFGGQLVKEVILH